MRMRIDRIYDHGDTLAVAGIDKLLQPIAPAKPVIGRVKVKRRITPLDILFYVCNRHQLDCVHPKSWR
jgi:hypothetical protein